MLNTPFADWPSYSEEEAQAVSRVLLSNRVNYWTGSECRRFEQEFANWVGAKHAVAVSNGTLALEAALRAIGIGPGDDVIVTARSFIASASCVVSVGARPVFADVDPISQNITAGTIRDALTPNTRAIICVHLAGLPCDMDSIMSLAAHHHIKVVEDCAQAHGARYRGRMVGSIGHIAAWSFCQDKIMTTGGEGGMVTTNDSETWSRVWSFKDHGKSWRAVYEKSHTVGFRWLHESIGTNGRMLEIQAVIGRIQLQRMPLWTARRNAIANRLTETTSRIEALRVPTVDFDALHAFYRYYAFVRSEHLRSGWNRDRILTEIAARGVPCFQGTCSEIYLEKAFQGTSSVPAERLPVAKSLGETSLAFLVHPTLSDDEVELTADTIESVFAEAAT